jgi:hypothetical protein
MMWLAAALLLALPAFASAATYTVNQAGPGAVADIESAGAANGICDADAAAGTQCTLREALKEANAASNNDTIRFGSSVFQGTHPDDYITLASGPLTVTREVTINGGNCAGSGTAKPCVGIDTNGISGLLVTADGVDIRGLAVFGANGGTGDRFGIGLEGDGDTVKGSWLGADLNGDFGFNSNGIVIQNAGDDAVIGGTTGADRNVFGYGTQPGNTWVNIIGADDNRIRGNYFGVLADGATAVGTSGTGIAIEDGGGSAVGNVIGKTVSSSAASTTTCDGGCNVISSAETGIELGEDVDGTKVKGNFIGLDKTGSTSLENTSFGVDVGDSDQTTIGGSTSADRNFITGGITAGIFQGSTSDSLSLTRNFIGLNSAGTMPLDPPEAYGVDMQSNAAKPSTASRNRFAVADGFQGLQTRGVGDRVVRNKFGLRKDGGDLPDASFAIAIAVQGEAGKIGEPGAGNTIGNIDYATGMAVLIQSTGGSSGDSNKVQGNYIGVDSAGVAHPNSGAGIQLAGGPDSPDDNVIGGGSAEAENVISNSGTDAIQVTGAATVGNQIKRNRGKENGNANGSDLFIDLGADGAGNGSGVHGGIAQPTLADSDPGDTTRTHTEGTCQANSTVYIFRTSNLDGEYPNRINGFVKTTICSGGGTFSTNFSQIPTGQSLTALNLHPTNGSSELALAVDPAGP